jgi:hypothetical protein
MSVLAALVADRGTVWRLFVFVAARIPRRRIWMGCIAGGERAEHHGRCDQHYMNFGEMPHRLTYEMREREERITPQSEFYRKAHARRSLT